MPTTQGEVASIKKEFVTVSKTADSIPKEGDNDKFQAIMSVSYAALFITYL